MLLWHGMPPEGNMQVWEGGRGRQLGAGDVATFAVPVTAPLPTL